MDAKKIDEGFPQNKIINGKWVIDGPLGGGGMGLVYRAHAADDENWVVVVKTLTDKALTDDFTVRHFSMEAEALKRINHDGVVKIYDNGNDRETGRPFIVMEFVDGPPLTDVIMRSRMVAGKCADLVRQIAFALKAAHEKDVLHRDLKPANILVVEREGEPDKLKLIDFGIAKVKESSVGRSTKAEMIVGTIEYFSPEQCSSSLNLTVQSEGFSLATVAYQMLTRELAFPVPNAGTMRDKTLKLRALHERGHKSPLKLRPDLPKPVEAVFLKGLAVDPEKRYKTPVMFAEALAAALESKVIRPRETVYPERSRWKEARRKMVPLAAALLLLLLLTGGAYYYFASGPDPDAKVSEAPAHQNSPRK